MAQNKNIFINIEVSNSKAKQALDATSESVKKLSTAKRQHTSDQEKLNFALSDEGKRKALTAEYTKRANAANRDYAKTTVDSLNGIKQLTDAEKENIKYSNDAAVAAAKLAVRKKEYNAQVKRNILEIEKYNVKTEQQTLEIQASAAAAKAAQPAFSMLNKAHLGLNSSINTNTKGLKQNRAQTGLNNAILIETGRVASDAAYGMQGIANNLGRLIELGQEFARTGQGGFFGAFKQLGKSLMGAGGIIVGIQLLLSFAPRIIKFFKDQVNPVNEYQKAIDGATKSLRDQIYTLDNLRSALDKYGDIGKFSEDTAKLFSAVSSEFRSAYESIKEGGTLEFVDSLQEKRLLKGDKAVKALIKRYKLLLEARIEEESLSAQIDKKREDGLVVSQYLLGRYTDAVRKRFNLEIKVSNDKKGAVEKDAEFELKVFEQKLDDLRKLEERYRRNSIDKDLMTEEEKIALQEKFNLKDLEIRQKAFEARERLRLKNFKDQTDAQRKQELDSARKASEEAGGDPETLKATELEINKKFDAAILDAEKTLQIELTDSKRQAAEVELQIKADTNTKLLKLDRKRAEDARRDLEQQIKIDRDIKNSRSLMEIQELTLVEDQKAETVLEGLLGLKRSELTIQGDLLNQKKAISDDEVKRLKGLLDNDELVGLQRSKIEQQLLNEQQNNTSIKMTLADAEANAKVQALEVTASAMNAFAKLVGENSEAGKALSVAATLVSTYSAAQKAYESQFMPIPTPDSPIRGTIAAAAAVASGLANVKAILSVDPKGENGSGVKPNVQAPAFNVVGASPTNQLAQTVGNNTPQILPVVFDSDLSDGLEPIEPLLGSDSGGVRSVG